MKRRSDGRWQKKVKIENQYVHFYSNAPTQKRAEEDFNQQLINYKIKRHSDKTNFLSIAERMIDKKEATTSYNNVVNYKNQLKHLSPLYEYNIEDITIFHLQELFNQMHSKLYGYWTLQKTKTVLGLIYKEAIYSGCKVSNIVELIKLPRAKKEVVHSPNDDIISCVKNNAKNDFGMWAMMLLCTGMRRGELAAIQVKDINFERKVISITKSIEYTPNQPNIKETKTQSGIRNVPIIDMLYPLLFTYCKGKNKNYYLFGGETPYTLTMLRKRWNKYTKLLNIEITQHQLRHAYSFLLYRSGVDVKSAQYLLGHSNYTTTMNIYTDFDKTKLDASADMLNCLLSKI